MTFHSNNHNAVHAQNRLALDVPVDKLFKKQNDE